MEVLDENTSFRFYNKDGMEVLYFNLQFVSSGNKKISNAIKMELSATTKCN